MFPAAARRALRLAGWVFLWTVAAVGLLLSAAALLAALPATRPLVAAAIIGGVEEAVAGKVELEGIAILPHGVVELRGLRISDRDGAPVLRVERARFFADALGLLERELRVSAELDGVTADAARRGEGGVLSIARALSPARARAPPEAGGEPSGKAPAPSRSGWTLRVSRLSITRARLLADAGGPRPVEVSGVSLEARGLWGPRAARVEARLTGTMDAPVAAPVSLELRAVRDGERVELQRLAAGVGADRIEAVGEGELAGRTGRLAVTRLDVSRREAGAFAPAAALAGGLEGTLYVESDGRIATAAVDFAPADELGAGRASVAVAARAGAAARALGLRVDIDRLDPSRLTRLAPPGRVTLHARGGASGTRLQDLSGRLSLTLERSRLRSGELGPVALQVSAGRGAVEVSRLQASLPGGTVAGELRWGDGSREVSGRLRVAAGDLRALARNLAGLLGRPVPQLTGAGRADVALSGSAKAPRLTAAVDGERLEVGAVKVEGARLRVEVQGPASDGSGRVEGSLRRAVVGGVAMRGVDLVAAVGAEEGSLSLTANVPQLGTELVRAMLRGRFGSGRAWFDLADATVAWPGTRFELQQPARISLSGPGVDRLLLASGAQRIELAGGFAPDGRLDARLRLSNGDLARLPRGLVPPDAALEGLLNVEARASGTRAAPRVEATIGLTGASAFDVGGLQLLGDAAWDGGAGRIEADLGLVREQGGAVDVSFDLPIALGRAGAVEPLRVDVTGRSVPLEELVWLAGSYALISGEVAVRASLSGTVGAPSLAAKIGVRDGTWDDLEGLGLDATLQASGDRAEAQARVALAGAGEGNVEGDGALDLSALLARPSAEIARGRERPFRLALRLPRLGLAPLAQRLGLPDDLAGSLSAEASLAGSLSAPRGTARLALAEGAGWGVRAVGGTLDVALAAERSGATLDLQLAGRPAARVAAGIDLPAERLVDRNALGGAPFRADATIVRSELAAWGGALVALKGTVEGGATLRGSLGAPQVDASLIAADASVEGRSLGGVTLVGRYAARHATAAVDLRPTAGGTLHAEAALDRPFGLGSEAGPLEAAPVQVRVHAEGLDLGFLPAVAPGLVRAASGAVTLDLAASGTIGELRPRGRFRVEKGRLALAELGDWTDAAIEADLGDDAIELKRFDVRKGRGTLSLRGSLRGLSSDAPAELEAKLVSRDFGVERAGMELARFDMNAEARGTLERRKLTLGVVIPQAEVKLPKRIPRTLQDLEARKDITVGRPRPRRYRRAERAPPAGAVEAAPGPAAPPFTTIVHLLAPRRLRVRADQPRIDVELKADAIFAFSGSQEEATGTIEAIRGQAEPIGGRVFELERGKVTFGGGRIAAGTLDVAARYDAPTAKVRALIEGTLGKPKLRLTSEPPLEEAQIAMLIATGRTEVKAGENGVGSLTGGDAGLAAAGAVVTGVFKDLLSDKLPVDSVSVDSTAVTAGKYLTDRIYVGYVRRFDAKPEKGENPDEVRIEYQLAPGWQVETRYGTGQSGGASIVWTRNY